MRREYPFPERPPDELRHPETRRARQGRAETVEKLRFVLMVKVKKIDAAPLLTPEEVRLKRLAQEIIAGRSARTGL